jgi:hypothetical protein
LKTFEIILPLRNPTAVLEQTTASVVAQTDRNFSVLLSDNHSTKGVEFIDAAVRQLEAIQDTCHKRSSAGGNENMRAGGAIISK